MADLITFRLRDSAGAALTGLTIGPAGLKFVGTDWKSRAGVAQALPTLFEIGGGAYGFIPSDADTLLGVLGVIDGTAAASPRYVVVQTSADSAPFQAVLAVDDAGALYAGAELPGLATWKDAALNVRTPPTVLAPSAYLFAFTPSTEDLSLDIAWTLTAQAGANLSVDSGFFNGTPTTALGPAVNPASDLADKLAALSPYGSITLVKEATGAPGENLFVGRVRPVRSEVPPLSVFCFGLRGPRPEPYLGIAEDFKRFAVEVTVRSNPGQYAAGHELARYLMERLQRSEIAGYIACLLEQSGPEHRGEDEERQSIFVFAVELWWKG